MTSKGHEIEVTFSLRIIRIMCDRWNFTRTVVQKKHCDSNCVQNIYLFIFIIYLFKRTKYT